MTGLEKMVSQIVDEAKAEAESRLNTAREEADSPNSQRQAPLIIWSVSNPPQTCSAEP